MGATTECMLEEMDRDWESTFIMLTQLNEGLPYLKELMEDEEALPALLALREKELPDLTKEDKILLYSNFDHVEMAYHYQDVSTKED
jgi:hypothetical protein